MDELETEAGGGDGGAVPFQPSAMTKAELILAHRRHEAHVDECMELDLESGLVDVLEEEPAPGFSRYVCRNGCGSPATLVRRTSRHRFRRVCLRCRNYEHFGRHDRTRAREREKYRRRRVNPGGYLTRDAMKANGTFVEEE